MYAQIFKGKYEQIEEQMEYIRTNETLEIIKKKSTWNDIFSEWG